MFLTTDLVSYITLSNCAFYFTRKPLINSLNNPQPFPYALCVVATPAQFTVPLAYKLNCFGPPQNAVPVVAAPLLPLQTSVHACAPVKLVMSDMPKLNDDPP